MKLYLTIEPEHTLKHVFSNLNNFEIIDVDKIIKDIGLDITIDRNVFIINSEIIELLKTYAKSKRIQGIIYINKNLNTNIINSLNEFVSNYEKSLIDQIILLDNYDIPRIKNLYSTVEEVLYFTCFKKVKIVECKNLFH